MSGKIILLSAPSGTGKSTLIRYLLETFPELSFSVSATTRKPRGQELNGQDYYFLTTQEFESAIAEKKFVEYEQVYSGYYYGTLLSEVNRIWTMGKSVVMDLDVMGALNIKKKFGSNALSIFILVSDVSTLRQRLEKRAEDAKQSVEQRLEKAEREMAQADKFDAIVFNDDLAQAKDELKNLIGKFLST